MELVIAIVVIVAIVVLPYGLLVKGYDENTKLTEENTKLSTEVSQLESRLDSMRYRLSSAVSDREDQELTPGKISEALQYYGYEQRSAPDRIRFKVEDLVYCIDITRMPLFTLSLEFAVNDREYNLERMKRAAHLMSDSLVMVKADIDETPDENGDKCVVFYLVAMDRNYASFKGNLGRYLNIIDEGRRRLLDFYEKIEKEESEALSNVSALLPSSNQETKVIS